MIKLGVEKIDNEIKVLEGSTILVIGIAEKVKDFCKSFIKEGTKNKEAILYITFETPANKLIEEFKDGYLEGKLIIIDVTGKAQLTNNIVIVNPTDLTSILAHALKIIKREESTIKRCYIESYSKVFDYIPPDLATRFLSVLIREIGKCGVTTVAEINKLLADQFRAYFDITIEMNEKIKIITKEFEKEI